MYKVIIIDDEDIVRAGIRTLINWNEINFDVCAEGKDGRDGLQKILQFNPHLVLVDIKMPGLSGLEVIKESKERGFNGQFIILSGYSEFEYAKTAISLGVKEYLLKPIDERELLNVVKNIYKEIQDNEGLTSYHLNNEEKGRKELLRQILLNLKEKNKLEEKIALYKLDLSSEIFCAAIVQERELMNGYVEPLFYEKVEELLIGIDAYVDKVLMEERIVLICHGLGYKKLTDMLRKGNERVNRKYGGNFLITIGHDVTNWYDLCYSYEFAKYLLEHEFLFDKQQILSIDMIHEQRESGSNVSVDLLGMLIEAGNLEGIKESVNHLKNYYREHLIKESEIKVQVLCNLMLLKTRIEKKYGADKCKTIDEAMMSEKILGMNELNELLNYYCYIMEHTCREVSSGMDTNSVIKRVYYYMEKNYDKDLKLENIARLFHYNSAYLGKIFHREIGETFNNSLDFIRITNAKRFLEETNMKVYQISEAVGFGNIDFFYQKFKKYESISPKEYKKKIKKD
jgi:two-component system, response regulator YesN